MVLVNAPALTTNPENAGPREFYHHYLADSLLIQSIIQEIKEVDHEISLAAPVYNFSINNRVKVAMSGRLEIKFSLLVAFSH
jgi:hypothetical protein